MHPFAEVLAEIAQARLSGSLRLSAKEKKRVLYFRDGRLVFGVSNARESRLCHLLLSKGKVSMDDLRHVPDPNQDFELSAHLTEKGIITADEHTALFAEQIMMIVVDILGWHEGDWSFSHLARARDGLDFQLNLNEVLVDYARALSQDQVLKRFRSLGERFGRSELPMNGLALSQTEAFVVSRADHGWLTASDIARVAAMPEAAALQILYTMWLAGYLDRTDWQPAFNEATIEAMRYAKLELKKEAKIFEFELTAPTTAQVETAALPEPASVPDTPAAIEITLDVEEFVDRVENGATYYDMLGVATEADAADIRRMYFALAKKFHPDKYHSSGPELRKRVQNAFTEISQAHETLKDSRARELYDYRMRTEITARKNSENSGDSVSTSVQLLQAAEAFDRGFTLLMNGETDEALPLLARAVHYAPKNARYHAYYGKALAYDPAKRHKAEGEMQAALRIDPQNATFRLMLIEFFIDMGLKKRAEGELNRLLAIFPANRDAKELLASLKKA